MYVSLNLILIKGIHILPAINISYYCCSIETKFLEFSGPALAVQCVVGLRPVVQQLALIRLNC